MAYKNNLLSLIVELSELIWMVLSSGLSCCAVRWLESLEGLTGLDVQDGIFTHHLAPRLGRPEQLEMAGHLSVCVASPHG